VFYSGNKENFHATENGSFSVNHTNRVFQSLLCYTRNNPLKPYRFRGSVNLHSLYVSICCLYVRLHYLYVILHRLHVRLHRLFVHQHHHEIILHHGNVKLHRVGVILHSLNVFKLHRYVNKHNGVVCLHRGEINHQCGCVFKLYAYVVLYRGCVICFSHYVINHYAGVVIHNDCICLQCLVVIKTSGVIERNRTVVYYTVAEDGHRPSHVETPSLCMVYKPGERRML
jgi:hypothetical protein